MLLHNRDSQGDWLPVTVAGEGLTGAEAVARLVEDRLRLFQTEWWEDPRVGNPVLEMFRTGRPTEMLLTQMTNMIAAYIQETPGVLAVEDVQASVLNREISFYCRVMTAEGEAFVSSWLQGP